MRQSYTALLVFFAALIPAGIHAQILRGNTTVSGTNNMTIEVTVNTNTNMVDIDITGTNGSWFGYGFGGSSMSGRYAIIVNGTGAIAEHQLGNHTQGSILSSMVTPSNNSVAGSVRTLNLSRARVGATGSHYTFPSSPGTISMIWARGSTSTLNQHPSGSRGAALLTLVDICNFPPTVLSAQQVCQGDSALIFGNWETQPGTYSTVLTASTGCDSTVQQDLNVSPAIGSSLPDLTICDGESAMIFGNTISTAGTYYDTLTATGGCDSIVDVTLIVEDLTFTASQNGATLSVTSANATHYEWIDCSDDSPVGNNTTSFTATANGQYAVVVSNSACTDTSQCFTVTGIGLDENEELQIEAMPVPFDQMLTINGLEPGTQLEVFNLTGSLIRTIRVDDTHVDIPTSEWPSGMYIIRATRADLINEIKVVKR